MVVTATHQRCATEAYQKVDPRCLAAGVAGSEGHCGEVETEGQDLELEEAAHEAETDRKESGKKISNITEVFKTSEPLV